MVPKKKLSNTLERELELNGLQAPDELPVNNINRQPSEEPDKQKDVCHYCKKPGHHKSQCRKTETRPKRRESNRQQQNMKKRINPKRNPNRK